MNIRPLLVVVIALLIPAAVHSKVTISPPANATPIEKLAARELQRYIYLRTGSLPEISNKTASERIVIATKKLGPEQFQIRTARAGTQRTWTITGGEDFGTLYGTYRFIEKLGVRFYLHGDVIPDKKLARLPDVNETAKPIFSIRGIQPFHDFPEGPDWWNTDDYLVYISQLPKMRMNFIGLHCYPEGIAEPSVWIGTGEDIGPGGQVEFSYPSHWANTAVNGN